MWLTRVDYESPHLCGYFETQIEVVTMKNVELDFCQRHEPEVCSSRWRASYMYSVCLLNPGKTLNMFRILTKHQKCGWNVKKKIM